jgi:hypothetical protein
MEDEMATTTARFTRQKISTTVSPKTFDYLDSLTRGGEARNLAEALDLAIEKLLAYENRERLARDTAAYFDNMSEEEAAEERQLETALSQSGLGIDFDK